MLRVRAARCNVFFKGVGFTTTAWKNVTINFMWGSWLALFVEQEEAI